MSADRSDDLVTVHHLCDACRARGTALELPTSDDPVGIPRWGSVPDGWLMARVCGRDYLVCSAVCARRIDSEFRAEQAGKPLVKVVKRRGSKVMLVVCDGHCDKSWGISGRPALYWMKDSAQPRALRPGEEPDDPDDMVYLPDSALGTAPDAGRLGKPCDGVLTDQTLMNRWCVDECERSSRIDPGEPFVLKDMERPMPNKRERWPHV